MAPLSLPKKAFSNVELVILSVPFFMLSRTVITRSAFGVDNWENEKVLKGAVLQFTAALNKPYRIIPADATGFASLHDSVPLKRIKEIDDAINPASAIAHRGDETGKIKPVRIPVITGLKIEKLFKFFEIANIDNSVTIENTVDVARSRRALVPKTYTPHIIMGTRAINILLCI